MGLDELTDGTFYGVQGHQLVLSIEALTGLKLSLGHCLRRRSCGMSISKKKGRRMLNEVYDRGLFVVLEHSVKARKESDQFNVRALVETSTKESP